jgi:hypothetical protein
MKWLKRTFRLLNISTSPKRSKTRKTSRRSGKVRAVGWILMWIDRATMLRVAEAIVVWVVNSRDINAGTVLQVPFLLSWVMGTEEELKLEA